MGLPILKQVRFGAVASGIKAGDALDLAVILLPENSITAAVFTKNIFCAAPVVIAKKHINNAVRALVINSGNANAGTGVDSGSKGLNNAYRMCVLVADAYKVSPTQVLPFSTGVIGQQLPMDCLEKHFNNLVINASEGDLALVAKAIMTTDTRTKIAHKTINHNGKTATVVGIAKGAGMICPNVATMLGFIITDLVASSKDELQQFLIEAANTSFNRITIDGDTSTNDALSLSATATSGITITEVDNFRSILGDISKDLAWQIVRDGEGATKFIQISVSGGKTTEDCLIVAYAIAHSPLVKTAFFASDANIGRLLMAIGKAKVCYSFSQSDVNIDINGVKIITSGVVDSAYTESIGAKQMVKTDIIINVSIGSSVHQEIVWTSDFSNDYIKINANYRS